MLFQVYSARATGWVAGGVTAEVRPCCSVDGHVGLCVDVHGACGRWTSGLLQRVLGRGSVVMRVDGPYGEFQDHPEWTHYRTLVIVAGGIGASLPRLACFT